MTQAVEFWKAPQAEAAAANLQALSDALPMLLSSRFDYELWYTYAAHVELPHAGVLFPYCLLLPQAVFLLHRDGQVHYLAMERYIPGTDETELDWQRMWKRFFKALTIEQRRDEKAQMSHVPKRFWQDMCEMQPDLASSAGAAVRKAD